MKRTLMLALGAVLLLAGHVTAQQAPIPVPLFQPDTTWPQSLPNNWVLTNVTKLSVDRGDNVYILHRPRQAKAGVAPTPSVVVVDAAGKFLRAWGGPGAGYDWPEVEHTIFVDHFDVPAIGKFVLGRYGRSATTEQLDAYQAVFQDYVVSTYNTRLTSYAGQTLDVIGATAGEEGRTIVKSRINQPAAGTSPIQVDWVMTGVDGSYKIIDVVIGGVSMALTQRSEFGSVIQSGGGTVDALITRLRDQVAAVNGQG